jgi:hypothetical protein
MDKIREWWCKKEIMGGYPDPDLDIGDETRFYEAEVIDKLLMRCAEAMETAQFYADGTQVCKEMDKLIDEIKGEL